MNISPVGGRSRLDAATRQQRNSYLLSSSIRANVTGILYRRKHVHLLTVHPGTDGGRPVQGFLAVPDADGCAACRLQAEGHGVGPANVVALLMEHTIDNVLQLPTADGLPVIVGWRYAFRIPITARAACSGPE